MRYSINININLNTAIQDIPSFPKCQFLLTGVDNSFTRFVGSEKKENKICLKYYLWNSEIVS